MDHPLCLRREAPCLRDEGFRRAGCEQVGESEGGQTVTRAAQEITPTEWGERGMHGGLVYKLKFVGEEKRLRKLLPRIWFLRGCGRQGRRD